jgi:radical SAM domain protein
LKQVIENLKCDFAGETFYVDFTDHVCPVKDTPSKQKEYINVRGFREEDPPYFVIYVTDQCNMNCNYCFNKSGNIMRRNLSPEYKIKDLVHFFKSLKVPEINIRFFGGEPMLNYTWIEKCIKNLEETDIKFNYNIFTNASIIDNAFLKYAISKNMQFFASLGSENEEFKGILFNDVIAKNVATIRKASPNVIGSVVWSPDQRLSIVDTIKKYKDTGILFTTFILTWGGQYIEENHSLILDELEAFAKFYVDSLLNHETWHLFIHPFIDYIVALLKGKVGNYDACAAGKNLASIATDGTIFPCHAFSTHTNFQAGNIYNCSWDRIFIEYNSNSMNRCKGCTIQYVCKGRCYYNNYMINGTITEPNYERCIIEKDIIACSAYIIKLMSRHKYEFSAFKKIIHMELKENVTH